MHPNKSLSGRQRLRISALVGTAAAALLAGGAAQAQEMTHRFINPSFGVNPFYSDHLLGIANIHRPEEPEEPGTPPVTEEELLSRQLQARLLSQLSTEIQSRISNARPGESGEFEFGNQRISFTRSATETRVTFVNTTTGESRLVIIPVPGTRASASASAEQTLGATAAPSAGSQGGLLAPPPL